MIKSKLNKLDKLLKSTVELEGQIEWKKYTHKDDFFYLCEIKGDKEKEKITFVSDSKNDMNRSCVYVMVIDDKIFKIGTALRGMKNRIGSYNSGKTMYRIKGTNSASNYWLLQSVINMGVSVTVFALYPDTKDCEVFGIKVTEPFPSAKTIEGVVIKLFEEEYGVKPIGCTQK